MIQRRVDKRIARFTPEERRKLHKLMKRRLAMWCKKYPERGLLYGPAQGSRPPSHSTRAATCSSSGLISVIEGPR
jgi:hypothetical protein